jgi:hypothetical protein
MALAGWSAPSAEGFRAFSERAEACGGALIGAVLAIGEHVHTYADELKAIQEAFAAAKHDADRAGERADSAERGSHAERAADEDLDDAKRAMGSARMAALEASRRTAERIRAVIEGLPAVPAPPTPPPVPAQDRPWYEDFAAWEYEQGLGVFKGIGEAVVGIGGGAAMFYRLSPTGRGCGSRTARRPQRGSQLDERRAGPKTRRCRAI